MSDHTHTRKHTQTHTLFNTHLHTHTPTHELQHTPTHTHPGFCILSLSFSIPLALCFPILLHPRSLPVITCKFFIHKTYSLRFFLQHGFHFLLQLLFAVSFHVTLLEEDPFRQVFDFSWIRHIVGLFSYAWLSFQICFQQTISFYIWIFPQCPNYLHKFVRKRYKIASVCLFFF